MPGKLSDFICRQCKTAFRKPARKGKNIYCSVDCQRLGALKDPDGVVVMENRQISELQVNFGNSYHVTSCGKIFKVRDGAWRQERTFNCKGYRLARIMGRLYRVHRAVAEVYCPNPENKPHVNHLDCNRANNHASNLEWVTNAENMQHAYEMGRIPRAKRPVVGFNRSGDGIFLSAMEKARLFGISPQGVWRAVTGNAKTAGGYVWSNY